MNKNKRSMIRLLEVTIKEIFNQKKWWLLPIWILICTIALVLIVSGSSFLIPAIYIAF